MNNKVTIHTRLIRKVAQMAESAFVRSGKNGRKKYGAVKQVKVVPKSRGGMGRSRFQKKKNGKIRNE